MKLKLTTLLGALALTGSLTAGPMTTPAPMQSPSEVLFGPGWTVGGHTLYVTPKGHQGERAWGGGLNLDYFFNANIGLAGSADWVRPNSTTWGNYTLDLVLRAPFEQYHIAPYAFGGLGTVHANNDQERTATEFLLRVGGGLDYRITRKFGLFSDFAWNWPTGGDGIPDYGMVRIGVKIGF